MKGSIDVDSIFNRSRRSGCSQEGGVRGPARHCGGPQRGGSHPRPRTEGFLALDADRRHRADDLPLHQPAVLAALLRRLHAAQHRVFLPADRVDAAVHVPDLPGNQHRISRSHSLVRPGAVRDHVRRVDLPDAVHPRGRVEWMGVRRRAPGRDLCRRDHVGPADGGAAAHWRLEPAAERAALHRLPAVCRRKMARAVPGHRVDARSGHLLSCALR